MISLDALPSEILRLLSLSKAYITVTASSLTLPYPLPFPLLLPLPLPLPRLKKLPFPRPSNTRRLALVATTTVCLFLLVVLLWTASHEDGYGSDALNLHVLTPDESFPDVYSPPRDDKGRGGKASAKKEKGKGMNDDNEKEKGEQPPKPLPKFWSVKEGTSRGETNMAKPPGVRKVMGLVFYNYRATASILDCYLKRNLIKNGGMLDGVIWVQKTTSPQDLVFLDRLVKSEPDYARLYVEPSTQRATGYDHIDKDVMYVKMDDDVVFLEDTLIPTLVHARHAHPEALLTSANLVGAEHEHPSLAWLHYSLGAVVPYLPELTNDFPIPLGRRVDWHASALPTWVGPRSFNASVWASPGGLPHRWLPLRGDQGRMLMNMTPIAGSKYQRDEGRRIHIPTARRGDRYQPQGNQQQQQQQQQHPKSTEFAPWQIAAQSHYSLLDTLETNDLGRYRFGLWDFHQSELGGLHLVAMMGSDINAAKPIPKNDAHHFTHTVPKRSGRHIIAAGEAVAAHYSSSRNSQSHDNNNLDTTDLLDRYRAFARENICVGADLLWSTVGNDPPVPWGIRPGD